MDKSQHVYRFHWDTDEHIMAIRNVSKLTKGCKCKRNSCKSKQCGCRHSGQTCGPGCQCINCENLLTTVTQTPASEVSEAAALYFQGNIVQSLRVREEFEEKTKKEVTSILKATVDQKVIKTMTTCDASLNFWFSPCRVQYLVILACPKPNSYVSKRLLFTLSFL